MLAVGIIEKDANNDLLWVWSYPNVTTEQQQILLRKCGLILDGGRGKLVSFSYCQFQSQWLYMSTSTISESDKLPNLCHVRQSVFVIIAANFNPEKYEALSKIFTKSYFKSGSPVILVQHFLSVAIHGMLSPDSIPEGFGTFQAEDYPQKQVMFAKSNIKDVIKTFQLEAIIIYNAIILKKRIFVYHHKLEHVLQFLRSLPAFCCHRQLWQNLFPHVDLVEEELQCLRKVSGYIAGSVDASVESRTDLYDIFVNLAATEITIAPHAKEYFFMSKAHKEIALFMLHLAEDQDITDQQVIKEIHEKTGELLQQLEIIKVECEGEVTLEGIRSKNYPTALENFLYNIAIAEGLIKSRKM